MVSDVPFSDGTTVSGDQQKMEQLAQAVYNYGFDVGVYPGSLDALVPTYISAVPTTSSGMVFVYNPVNGMVYHPDPMNMDQPATNEGQPAAYGGQPQPAYAQPQPQPQPQPRTRQPAVSGGGMVGEAMTGIAIQQDLNSMSSAGTSSVGSRMRQQARDLGQRRQ
jgi:hypothetical protein